MNAQFSRHQQDETESPWFKVAHALVGVLVLIALLMLAATGWNSLLSESPLSVLSTTGQPMAGAASTSAITPASTEVPDAATVFRGIETPPETQPPTF